MANHLPASFENNTYRGGNIVIDLSGNNQNYQELISAYDSAKPAIYLGDGWCTFPDLDNFDSEKLLKAFTLKEKDSCDSIWDPSLTYTDSCQRTSLSISALRQLEALFNLSQLLFGLSRAETVNYTFRDLQLRKHPHSFKKSGFKQLSFEGRTDFYAIFEQLVNVIIEEGGLEVTLLMYKNPMLPMVRQKCLDLISNVSTVPDVAFKLMRHQSWFLDHLLILVRDGEIVSDKIPALSVLIRLLKVMLTGRMISAYMKLVDMQYIDCLVDIFENRALTDSAEFLPFFIKFEFITMQSLTVILGDAEYSQLWSDKAKTRLLNYCMIVFLKAAGAYPTVTTGHDCQDQINHIFYAEQHTNKHSLAHTIMAVTELLRNDENMKLFYRYHRPFKQLIIQLYKKYGAKSQYIRTDPGISYALNHLMRVLYIKNTHPTSHLASSTTTISSIQSNKPQTNRMHSTKNLLTGEVEDRKPPRVCSNPECKNEETKYKKFKECKNCNNQVGYCSSKCKRAHIGTHMINECRHDELINNGKRHSTPAECLEQNEEIYENMRSTRKQSQQQYQNIPQFQSIGDQAKSYNRIYSSTSTSNYQKNTNNRRVSENLHQKYYQEHFQQRRRESSGGRECNNQGGVKSRKLSKFSSMNDNNHRNSLTDYQFVDTTRSSITNRMSVQTVYAKHTSSMKETKSVALRRMSALDEDTNNKLKLINSRDNHQTKSIVMNDTTTSSLQFHRPLKTSTALCLPDLTRRQSLKEEMILENFNEDQTIYKKENALVDTQMTNQGKLIAPELFQKNSDSSSSCASNVSSSESTSISSSISNNPQKKFKTTTGSKSIPKIEKMKESKLRQREKKQNLSDPSSSKRRHSTTSTNLTTSSSSSSNSSTAIQTITTGKSPVISDQDKSPLANNNDRNAIQEALFYHGCGFTNQANTSNNENNTDDDAKEAMQFIDDIESSRSYSTDENSETEAEDVFSSPEDSSQSSIEDEDMKNEKIELAQNVNELKSQFSDQKFKINGNSNEEADEDEVESERWSVTTNNAHNNIENLQGKRMISVNESTESINEDEQDRRSQFKVIKEFEKTMEFVKNASNLKVMGSLPDPQESEDIIEKLEENEEPEMSLASLYYNEDESKNLKLISDEENDSDSDVSTHEFTKRPSLRGRKLKNVNLIINNSIDSHMLTNNYSIKHRPTPTPNANKMLNRKNTDSNLKNHYQKNFISRCNSIGNSNNTNTPYFGGNKILNDRKTIDDSDGYRGGDFAGNTEQEHPNCIGEQFIDDEMSLFKNKNETLMASKHSDYRAFKTQLMQPNNQGNSGKENIFHGVASTPNLQYSAKSSQAHKNRRSVLINNELITQKEERMDPNTYQTPQQPVFVQKPGELKVFSNINTNLTLNSLNQTDQTTTVGIKSELPKNSTPISTDHGTQQHLSAKHRHFLNAQLDLTIVPNKKQSQQQQLTQESLARKKKTMSPGQQKSVFLVPQVPSVSEEKQMIASTPMPNVIETLKKPSLATSYKTSTLKSNSNLFVSSAIMKKKMGSHLLSSDILDVSKISALENATSTNACVVVEKADMPKDLRKCLKDEFKKDKKQCSIS